MAKLDLHAAIESNRKFVLRVRDEVFPHVAPDHVKFCHEDDHHYIEFGGYTFHAAEGVRETIDGDHPSLKWDMTMWVTQCNYPYAPDDVEEQDIDQFDSIADCFGAIARIEMENRLGGIYESMQYEEIDAAEEALECMQDEPPQLCPHGKQFHECNPCMVASDLAYDAARENRHFGRGR
jgi:hypothetical protein